MASWCHIWGGALLHKSSWLPPFDSRVLVGSHEQTHTSDVPHNELARLQCGPEVARFAADLLPGNACLHAVSDGLTLRRFGWLSPAESGAVRLRSPTRRSKRA
jgi:hypothetical protein